MNDWIHNAIVLLLRVGVTLSIAVILFGMAVTFRHHPEYFSSRSALGTVTSPETHFPNTLADVVAGIRAGSGEAIVMAGLLILIATPVARVALSVIMFIIARDWLYTGLTAVVLVILLISFTVGLVGG